MTNLFEKGLLHRSHYPAPTLRHLWLSMPFFFIVLKGFLFPLPLLDFWWHLRMGRVILENFAIPRTDIFSFTAAGKIFIVQNWLAEVLFYLIYRAGGFTLLVFINAALLFSTLLPIFYLCKKSSKLLWPGVFSAGLVTLCISCNMRPQVFSDLLFSIFYWLLSSYCSGKRVWIYTLPILMVLWVNLHGAFVLGLALVAIFFFCESARSFLYNSQDVLGRSRLRILGLVLICCLLATLANPELYHIYSYVRTVVDDPSSRQLVMEWQPPAINQLQGFLQFYLPFFLLTFVLICSRQRPGLTELALYLGFSAFGMAAIRNSTWFLLISAPILARHLPFINWAIFHLPPQANSHAPFEQHLRMTQRFSMNIAIATVFFVILIIQSPWSRERFHPIALLEPGTPVGAMDFIDRNALKGKIFHPQGYGDYLIWRLWPRQHSFFDGRVHLFGESFVRSYQRIFQDSHWEKLLDKYDIRYLLLSKSEDKPDEKRIIESARRSKGWKLLYEDHISVLFEKASRHVSQEHFAQQK